MIVSYSHRFVFVKNPKTAGSSIEVALSPLCEADDVFTVLTPPEPGHQPRNISSFKETLADLPEANEAETRSGLAEALGLHPADWPDGAMPHLPAYIIARSHPRMWSDFFTFCVERNPWDKMVSAYEMNVAHVERKPFSEWLPTGLYFLGGDHTYRDPNGEILVDRVLRYENLDSELHDVFELLGLGHVELPRSKSGFRPSATWREYYSDHDRQLVADTCARQIGQFGYAF